MMGQALRGDGLEQHGGPPLEHTGDFWWGNGHSRRSLDSRRSFGRKRRADSNGGLAAEGGESTRRPWRRAFLGRSGECEGGSSVAMAKVQVAWTTGYHLKRNRTSGLMIGKPTASPSNIETNPAPS